MSNGMISQILDTKSKRRGLGVRRFNDAVQGGEGVAFREIGPAVEDWPERVDGLTNGLCPPSLYVPEAGNE